MGRYFCPVCRDADAILNHAATFHTVAFDTVRFYPSQPLTPAILWIEPDSPDAQGAGIEFNADELAEFIAWLQELAT